MYICPRCNRRVFAYNMAFHVKEVNYQDGCVIIHEHVCIQCKLYIEYRNNIYYILSHFFEADYQRLVRMREEARQNMKGV